MKKVIVILTHVTFDNSPYCRFVHEHAKELERQGYKVVVCAIIHWFPIISHFQKYKKCFMSKIKHQNKIEIIDGVEIIYKKSLSFSNFLYNSKINLNGFFYYMSIRNIFKKLNKENQIVMIDAHTFKEEGYVAYKLKKKYPNIMTLVTLHGTSFFKNTRTKNGIKSIKKIFNEVNYAICVSNKFENILHSLNIKNTKVIFNGINSYKTKEMNKERKKFNIISVGSLDVWKRHDVTIKSIVNLSKKYPNIKLTIVGNGNNKEKLEKLVADLNANEIVQFKSNISNNEVLELMSESYIFLLPSINEGFGIVYAEAMNMGCITIGTRNEGIDGFINNGENGFLVNSEEKEIINLIEEIYENKYNLKAIRENAYNTVKDLTWEKNARSYIEILQVDRSE